ncbi:hypothetical protein SKAU_G00048330 [Synaphobranchus kaupii]|uniref:ZP domain-containing protein n=1 Tax=Synaphobranchus kaupii TaxID=118154 RepID=A0A9Q1J965_SYNKA|nr:hypothetical protein SKAU_G00048330 [Synaphobranchus kaupii]
MFLNAHVAFSRKGSFSLKHVYLCVSSLTADITAAFVFVGKLQQYCLLHLLGYKCQRLCAETRYRIHTLRTKYGGISEVWNFSIVSDSINVSSIPRSASLPSPQFPSNTIEALKTFKSNEVFPCEKDTHYLYQKEDFIIALGHSHHFPLRVESWDASSLLISWRGSPHLPPAHLRRVTLYRPDLDRLAVLYNKTTLTSHYRFGRLEACRNYVACVETARGASLLCLTALTDPDVPRNFRVTAWNSSCVTVEWDCPANDLASFLVTVFHLDSSGRILEEKSFGQAPDNSVFTVAGLPPCSMVKLGLQAVCQSQAQSRHSRMLLSDGNSANSEIINLHQSSYGPHSYTVSWSVRNTSSISSFRVYHEGELQSYTFGTSYVVTGLQPCQRYSCRVEAMCGDSTVMSVDTVQTKTGGSGSVEAGPYGPGDVLDLRFRQKDSTVLWSSMSAVAFLYRLSESGDPDIRKGRLADSTLLLPGLRPGAPYDLEVVAECDGGERGASAVLYFVAEGAPGNAPNDASGDESSGTPSDTLLPRVVDSTAQTTDHLDFKLHLSDHKMFLVVPWTMPPSLKDPKAPRAALESIVKNKLQNLLKKSWPKVEVQLISFEDCEKKTKTKITFESFDVSSQDELVSLHPEEQLQYINSLNHPYITVMEDTIYWDDPDECDSPALIKCGSNSLCINTLDSFTCVCEPGLPRVEVKSLLVKSVLKLRKCCQVVQKLMNQTHVELRNMLIVTLDSSTSITRRDLKVLWTCAYPLLHTSAAHMKPNLHWYSSHSVVQVNSSRLLEIRMALYSDSSYTYNYTGPVELASSEHLYIQVSLHSENTLAYDMNLQVEACWATEGANPQEEKKAFVLREGCPNDRTFRWFLDNSSDQRRRFSVQMFTMSDYAHIYLHCLARICSQEENCTTNCSSRESGKVRRDLPDKLTAIVSTGPISAAKGNLSHWAGALITLSVGGGLIGLFVLTALGVRAVQVLAQHNLTHQ